jgi:hypothetical protein
MQNVGKTFLINGAKALLLTLAFGGQKKPSEGLATTTGGSTYLKPLT